MDSTSRDYTLSRILSGIGTDLNDAAPSAVTYPLFHSEGTELTDLAFTFLGTDDYESIIEYFLVHPATSNTSERTLASGEFTNIQQDTTTQIALTAGTLGYLQPVYLRLRARTAGTNLPGLTSLLVSFVLQRRALPSDDNGPTPQTSTPYQTA